MGVVIVLALVTILVALRTELPRSPGVMSDALGPDPGERVGDYLDRAAASLATVGGGTDVPGGAGDDGDDEGRVTDPDAHRWALVSAGEAWSLAEAAGAVRGLPRVSGLSVQVPVEGVAMPVTGVALAEPVAGETGREAVFGRGLEQVAARLDLAPAGSDRAAAAAALTASRIRAGESAIIGLLVRGTTGQLHAVAGTPGVRAVEALPPDAVYERFAVRPLLPQQVDAALPLPDDAPVPPA
ncbi:hypothetical protein C3V38_12270 [Dietzia sp. oral taxon 368]|nr:hypothetical protein C3V38_12270 [Dietzia sp. oral taxon 368]